MAFSATDVGPRIDLLLDGQGYIFDDTLDSGSVYSQHQRAELGLSPIFVERQNVQGNYGDNQQDFWLTFSQKDWSLGEQQRYARPNDDDSARRYWTGTNIDIRSLPGQASIREAVTTLTFAASVKCANGDAPNDVITVATTANLYTIDNAGTITDKGAHGLGVAPTTMTSDPIVHLHQLDGRGNGRGPEIWGGFLHLLGNRQRSTRLQQQHALRLPGRYQRPDPLRLSRSRHLALHLEER
jgi:hypothetical protein